MFALQPGGATYSVRLPFHCLKQSPSNRFRLVSLRSDGDKEEAMDSFYPKSLLSRAEIGETTFRRIVVRRSTRLAPLCRRNPHMRNLLLGIVIGLCIIAFVKASNPLDSGQVVWLPNTYGTVNGHGYRLASHQTAESHGEDSVDNLSRFA